MPLSHEYDSWETPTRIGVVTTMRCVQALRKLRQLQDEGHEVIVVLPTPSLRTKDGVVAKTMGLMMYEWFTHAASVSGVEYIVNRTDREYPHTTYGELLWGLPAVFEHRQQRYAKDASLGISAPSDTTIVIVSNERHLKRVRLLIRLMLPQYLHAECDAGGAGCSPKPNLSYESSHDPQSSLPHEFLSYCKLALMWLGVVRH